MSELRAYRFQMRPTGAQRRLLKQISGCLRWVWNQAIAEQQRRHQAGEKFAGHAQMCKWLTAWRNAPETAWLAEAPIHPQQQVLRRLEDAYKRFFEKKAGYPRFTKRGQEPGIRFPDPLQFRLDQRQVGERENSAEGLAKWCAKGRIKLPKLGWVGLRQSLQIQGKLKNVSLVQDRGEWYCSLQVELDHHTVLQDKPAVGIDLGVAAFAATSSGQMIDGLKALAKMAQRLKRYQRAVNRKKKGSRNRRKAIDRLSRLHQRIARQRSDWLHKCSSELAQNHSLIAVEDLKIQNMTASARGTVEDPGKNARQKAGLNRSILDCAWGEFLRQLEYKVHWHGGHLVRVNPAYTSQTCSSCGHVHKDNRRSQARFECVACGQQENADVNAAKNILAAGHAVWSNPSTAACGEVIRRASRKSSRAASTKQEPTEGLA